LVLYYTHHGTLVKTSGHARPLSTGLGYLVRTTHKVMSRRLASELAAHGISFKQYFYCARARGGSHLTIELSERVGMNRATVTSVIDTMERQGFVRVCPIPTIGAYT